MEKHLNEKLNIIPLLYGSPGLEVQTGHNINPYEL